MGWVVVTPAAATELTTVDTVKDELRITGQAEDDYLLRLIRRVSSEIRDRTGQQFTREEIRETLSGSGSARLVLSRTPLVSPLTSVTVDSSVVTDALIEDAGAGFLFRDAGWPRLSVPSSGLSLEYFPSLEGNIVIQYVGGYILPSFDTVDSDLPGIIEQCAIDMVLERYRRRGREAGIKSESVGDYAVTYSDELRERLAIDLAPYMRVA